MHQVVTTTFGGVTELTTPAVGPHFHPRTETLEIDPLPPTFRIWELHEEGGWSRVLRCRIE